MDQKLLDQICKRIYKQFPEVNGKKPKVLKQAQNKLLLFEGTAKTPDGHTIKRSVRVVINPDGKVKKITTSR
jgi:hypothetical protein